MMMRPNRGTRRTPRAVRTEGARKLIFAARAETDCCIVSQSTSSAYKIPSLTPAKAWTRMSDLTYRFSGEQFVVISDDINADDALTLDCGFARWRNKRRNDQHRHRELRTLARCSKLSTRVFTRRKRRVGIASSVPENRFVSSKTAKNIPLN